MKKDYFIEAMTIISQNHTNEVVINKVKDNEFKNVDTHSDNVRLHIKECVPAVINKLKDAGFMLSMDSGLMLVEKHWDKH